MFQISGSLVKQTQSKAEFSQKAIFTEKLSNERSVKNFIQTALFFNYAITFSQVQTDISINYCFCFYSFDRKNKSLYYAKASLVALKSRERTYISYYSRHP